MPIWTEFNNEHSFFRIKRVQIFSALFDLILEKVTSGYPCNAYSHLSMWACAFSMHKADIHTFSIKQNEGVLQQTFTSFSIKNLAW